MEYYNGIPNYKRAESQALILLNRAGLTEPPVNPIELAKICNVSVHFANFSDESGKISGFYDAADAAIIVNRNEPPLRQTFTIAHELGHKILHEDWAKTTEYKVLLRDPDTNRQDFREKEANAFAANLLMPRFMMDIYYNLLSVESLSILFAVSVPAVRARLSFLYGI
jgi:Zn-dependent peptidase ImmA (M78 family)